MPGALPTWKPKITLEKKCKEVDVDMLFIAEPMVNIEKIPSSFWKGMNLNFIAVNDGCPKQPILWCFTKNNTISCSLSTWCEQAILV